jgi:GH15 family glucan-1,4-alpha-glucosidase
MIRRERLTANIEGDFVVFLIGMRINNPLKIHKWLPVAMAMPRMIDELTRHPELGLMHAESWFSRTIILVQYWRSMEQLMAYAKNKEAAHLPAWKAFNKSVGTDGSVGIWHETYAVSPGSFESVYVNMPAFGLGKAGSLQAAVGGLQSAAGRLRAHKDVG